MMKLVRMMIPVVLLSLVFVGQTGGTMQQQELPEGEGKELFANKCSQCHVVEYATAHRRTRGQWNGVLNEMIEMGAVLSDDQKTTIVAYLTKNFGKINVNVAPAEEIETFLGMSSSNAKAIVAYRTERGPFESVEDLKKVPGIDLTILEEKKGWIAF
jgi:competence protein ComEA